MRKLVIAVVTAAIVFSAWGSGGWAAGSHSQAGAKKKGTVKITGCSAKGTVSYMYWGDSGDDAAHLKSIALAEKQCKGLHVNKDWDTGNYDVDLLTKVGSGNAPDLFQLDASKHVPEYVSLGGLAPVDSYIKKYNINMNKTYWPQCVKELTYKGHVYGLPRTCSNQSLLFYNKEMFQARGVKFPTNNWTYADLAKAGAKLSGTYSLPHDSTSQLRFGMALNTDDYRIQQFMWDWGGDWLNTKLNQCTITSAAARKGLQYLHDLAYVHHAMPTAAQASGLPNYFAGFQKERYAMAFMGPWALDYAFGKKPGGTPQIDFQWGVALTPKGPKGRQALLSSTGLEIYKNSPHKDAAFWLARFDTVGPGAVLTGAYGVDMPGAKALWNNPQVIKEYGKSTMATIRLSNKSGRHPKLVPQYTKFFNVINNDLQPFWQDNASVNEVTSKACSDVTSQGLLH